MILEAESSLSASEEEAEDFDGGGHSGNDIRQLKARHHALTNKLAQRQKRLDKIQVKSYLQCQPFYILDISQIWSKGWEM